MAGAGKLFFFFDGEKVKLARGINSLVTTVQDKGTSFQKIKLVDLMDMMHDDIHTTAQDHYLGKYANSYANRCLLVTAIQGYLDQLAQEGLRNRTRIPPISMWNPRRSGWNPTANIPKRNWLTCPKWTSSWPISEAMCSSPSKRRSWMPWKM